MPEPCAQFNGSDTNLACRPRLHQTSMAFLFPLPVMTGRITVRLGPVRTVQ